ncbi:MAG: 2-amino-4-hydroxy-6-hydroxymethyldihydropteridine diphosphokinase [Akkermansiaceae bacterium]|jgi:2-amino-4-hydroxy-6-hydroxymethyldihydropteridine diphosphokinase|nr:2-amino-4-hydroxy-6-hydroxymethyldihydropteridine diphosphokinase [Akkermansiaceae bacterium]
MTPRAGIALGSNLGDRLAHLQAARDFFREISSGDLLQGKIYQTAPVACPDGSPDFLNTVIDFPFAGSPRDLLDAAMEIERRRGRIRAERNGPRTLDADLLYLGETVLAEPDLILPHPRLHLRRFVLEPLHDIRPDLVLPGQSESVASLLAALAKDESAPSILPCPGL